MQTSEVYTEASSGTISGRRAYFAAGDNERGGVSDDERLALRGRFVDVIIVHSDVGL